jgi:hypothetical protein
MHVLILEGLTELSCALGIQRCLEEHWKRVRRGGISGKFGPKACVLMFTPSSHDIGPRCNSTKLCVWKTVDAGERPRIS